MEATVSALKPPQLWRHFWSLTQIPRPSGHEKKVSQYVKDLAAGKGLKWAEDGTGNLVVRTPGVGTGVTAPPVLIQGHLDVVCEKNNDVEHDFFSDPLKLEINGDWLKAKGTTLGADNGIGVAAALAMIDSPPTCCPPLELLFTVDEESGLTGAKDLDATALGLSSKTMLNLDTEEWGEVCIGCSGGGDARLELKVESEEIPSGHESFSLRVSGLLGGHSGLEINQYRGNALKWIAAILEEILRSVPECRIVELEGGDKRNALPREAWATVSIPSSEVESTKSAVAASFAVLREEYSRKEKQADATLNPAEGTSTSCLTPESQSRLLGLLVGLPHGPQKFSHAMPELVETSCNLASIKLDAKESKYTIVMSIRSSISGALERTRRQIQTVGNLCGATCTTNEAYPGWNPEPDAPIVKLVSKCYEDMNGAQPKIVALHAGLECGILGERIPGIGMVSYGPTIKGAHSPDERVHIPSVDLFWQLTLRVLESLGKP
ncbi:hypothetical protein BSKO_06576 [Bryopsis sp. KO-2023]|nr:hypothetical protein BSKO_06576 [Bryopsis sp. KO-2023]